MNLSLLLVVVLCSGSQAASNALRFIVLGDNGGSGHSPYTSTIERSVADRIAQIAADRDVDFILELGDNFYEYGVRNLEDHRFRDTFETVYHHSSLQIPWYIIAGNHDHRGNVSAQIAYSKHSKRWNFPYYYYPLNFKIPGSDASIDLVMLDTITLCGHSDDESMLQPTGPEDPDDADAQWNFVTNMLKLSKATYLWTMGHYPVYSIGSHGPTSCLTRGLLPLMEQYKVNGHMSGHDHNLQHLQTTHNGHTMDYIVSGCASKLSTHWSHMRSVPSSSLKFHWADTHAHGGFVYVEATASSMTSTFVDSMGKVLHRVVTQPRKV